MKYLFFILRPEEIHFVLSSLWMSPIILRLILLKLVPVDRQCDEDNIWYAFTRFCDPVY